MVKWSSKIVKIFNLVVFFKNILLHSTVKLLNFIGQNNLFSITVALVVVPAAIKITNLY